MVKDDHLKYPSQSTFSFMLPRNPDAGQGLGLVQAVLYHTQSSLTTGDSLLIASSIMCNFTQTDRFSTGGITETCGWKCDEGGVSL